jgi:hypothetical protein
MLFLTNLLVLFQDNRKLGFLGDLVCPTSSLPCPFPTRAWFLELGDASPSPLVHPASPRMLSSSWRRAPSAGQRPGAQRRSILVAAGDWSTWPTLRPRFEDRRKVSLHPPIRASTWAPLIRLYFFSLKQERSNGPTPSRSAQICGIQPGRCFFKNPIKL